MFKKQKLIQIILQLLIVFTVFAGNVNYASAQLGNNGGNELPKYSGVEDSIRQYLCTPEAAGQADTILADCIGKLYRFSIAFGSIALVFFFVIAGYMYITGGEAGKQKGKSVFISALTGMAIILLSYLLLAFINPDLTKFKPINPPVFSDPGLPTCEQIGYTEQCTLPGGGTYNPGTGGGGAGDVTAPGYVPQDDGCGGHPAPLCRALYPNNRCDAAVTARCNSSEYTQIFNQGLALYTQKGGRGVSGLNMMKLVKAIAAVERGCNRTGACSPAGACGMMQFIPDSAQRYAPRCGAQVGNWPQWANDNPVIQVCMAAFHLQDNENLCGNQVRNVAAGYNAGAGNCQRSTDPKCNVSSCDGTRPLRKWECKCNRGQHYYETATYGPAVSGCYSNAF